MKKSIYSLVLADDIVNAVDRIAYEQGTSRSNLINQILAEHLSFATPEMRIRDIFSSMEKMMQDTFPMYTRSSENTLQVRSMLRYKYNPSIRYQLELNRDSSEAVGTLRISLRTTSRQLISLLSSFIELWVRLEHQWAEPVLGHPIRCRAEEGRLVRELYHPANLPAYTGEAVGNAIADYIRRLDAAVKLFFSLADRSPGEQALAVSRFYQHAISSEDTVII